MSIKQRGAALFKAAQSILAEDGVKNQYGLMASKGDWAIQSQYYAGEQHCRIHQDRIVGGISVAVSASGEVECHYPALLDTAEKVVANW